MTETITLLADDKTQGITITIGLDPQQLLSIARAGPFDPQAATARLIDAAPLRNGLRNTGPTGIDQTERRSELIHYKKNTISEQPKITGQQNGGKATDYGSHTRKKKDPIDDD